MRHLKVFDDWKSAVHVVLGVMVGALAGPLGVIAATMFVIYEVKTSKSAEEFFGDIFEFFWGYFVYLLLH